VIEGLPTGRRGQALAVALLLLVLAAAWMAVASPLLDWHADRAEALQQRSTLARRMAQVAAGLPELQRQAAAAAAVGPVAATLLDGSTDAVAGATLQQLVQDMAGRAGATLSSTETLPAEAVANYRRIGVRVALSAPWAVLVELLRAIEQASPQMLVDELQIHGGRRFGVAGEPPLEASFTVLGFRAP
jgi:general secretion pathway protein M